MWRDGTAGSVSQNDGEAGRTGGLTSPLLVWARPGDCAVDSPASRAGHTCRCPKPVRAPETQRRALGSWRHLVCSVPSRHPCHLPGPCPAHCWVALGLWEGRGCCRFCLAKPRAPSSVGSPGDGGRGRASWTGTGGEDPAMGFQPPPPPCHAGRSGPAWSLPLAAQLCLSQLRMEEMPVSPSARLQFEPPWDRPQLPLPSLSPSSSSQGRDTHSAWRFTAGSRVTCSFCPLTTQLRVLSPVRCPTDPRRRRRRRRPLRLLSVLFFIL